VDLAECVKLVLEEVLGQDVQVFVAADKFLALREFVPLVTVEHFAGQLKRGVGWHKRVLEGVDLHAFGSDVVVHLRGQLQVNDTCAHVASATLNDVLECVTISLQFLCYQNFVHVLDYLQFVYLFQFDDVRKLGQPPDARAG